MIGSIVGTKTIGTLFEERAVLYGEKEFLIFENKAGEVERYSYCEFNKWVNRLAHGLIRLSISKGDKVVVHLANSPEFIVSWFALSKIGAVMVPTNIHSVGAELEYIINFSDAKYIITEIGYIDVFNNVIGDCKNIIKIIVCKADANTKDTILPMSELLDDNVSNPHVEVSPGDVNEMLFTSGTTSRPKGALLTHEGIVYQGYATGFQLWLSPNDRMMITLPLFHVNGQLLTLVPTITFGGTIILIEEYSASKFMNQVRTHKATFTCIVPTILRTLLKQPPQSNDSDHSLRSCFYALPTSQEEWSEFENRFNFRLMDGYGLTEAYALATANQYWGLRKRHCVGIPAIGLEIKLIDADGAVITKPGEPGEFLIKGKPIFKEYYKNREETDKAIDSDGWLHTGDIGYKDSDGYFYFYDRKKDIIKRAGENISASEVERVLNDHHNILESAVVSVPDKFRDEAVFAFVVVDPNSNISPDEIKDFCKQRLAAFKVPQYVAIKDKFEKTSVGKIKKPLYKTEALAIYNGMME